MSGRSSAVLVLATSIALGACDPHPVTAPMPSGKATTTSSEPHRVAGDPYAGEVRPLDDDESIVISRDALIGWWDGERWQRPVAGVPIPSSPGLEYTVVDVDGQTHRTYESGALFRAPDGCQRGNTPRVSLVPDLFGRGVAVGGARQPAPRPTRHERPTADHQARATSLLRTLGVREPVPRVEVVLRSDLDGDGRDELLVHAENGMPPSFGYGRPDDASLVFVVTADGANLVVVENVLDATSSPHDMAAYTIVAVADLNDDGRMELVLAGDYWEGFGYVVFDFADGKAIEVLSSYCGA